MFFALYKRLLNKWGRSLFAQFRNLGILVNVSIYPKLLNHPITIPLSSVS